MGCHDHFLVAFRRARSRRRRRKRQRSGIAADIGFACAQMGEREAEAAVTVRFRQLQVPGPIVDSYRNDVLESLSRLGRTQSIVPVAAVTSKANEVAC
jgi:hypothetical protein